MNIIIFASSIIGLIYFWYKEREKRRLAFIENYKFSRVLVKRVQKQHDYLSDVAMLQVMKGLRDYFHICSRAKGKMVAMPSEIVDVAWHEFLLFTREYQMFCKKGIGKFLHHTPTKTMKSKTSAKEGIKRAWRLACAKEKINPKHPMVLPLIFAIDDLLKIKGGFTYQLNCKASPLSSSTTSCGSYCATHIGCASGCGGDSGSSGCMGSSSSSSSSDGGSSCGGS